MSSFKITNENWLLYASANYDNPSCYDMEEFQSDLKRVVMIKRLITRHANGGELRDRLILNHLIIFYNVFGVEAGTKILIFKLQSILEQLKPFLEFLNTCPKIIHGIGEDNLSICMDSVKRDETIRRHLLASIR